MVMLWCGLLFHPVSWC